MTTKALIFDMDGTMVDSIPWHAKSWAVFAVRHGLDITVPDLMRRTNGRNGAECMVELFQRDMPAVQGCILMIVLFFLFINTLVDIAYVVIDPRIRYG